MTVDKPKSQLAKFKEAAKQAETDDSEEAFDRALKKVAIQPTYPKKRAPKKS